LAFGESPPKYLSFVVPAVCQLQKDAVLSRASPPSRGLGLVSVRIMHEDPGHDQVKSGSFTYTHLHGTFLEVAGLHCLCKSIKGLLSGYIIFGSDYNYHTLGKLRAAN